MNTLDLLERLVAFPTVSAESNLPLIDHVQDFLVSRGFEVHRVTDPGGQKAGLFARIGPTDRPGILLSGHTDVVPVIGQDWSRDPFRLTCAAGRAYGRGTTDMKGYLAAMLRLADRAARTDLKEPLKLAFSWDEEVGCLGMREMIGHLDSTIGLPRLAIIGEPTEMQVAIGHKGKRAFRAVCQGRGGHSALAPRFLNALHLATDFIAALRDIQTDLEAHGARDSSYDVAFSTLHVGRLTGGTALNLVPESAKLDFELRHLAQDDPDALTARVTLAAGEIASRARHHFPEARIEISPLAAYPGLATDPAAPVVDFATRLAGSRTTKVAFGTEAGFFARLGIASVVCGPGNMAADGHKPDEGIALAQLAACDAMLERLLEELAR